MFVETIDGSSTLSSPRFEEAETTWSSTFKRSAVSSDSKVGVGEVVRFQAFRLSHHVEKLS